MLELLEEEDLPRPRVFVNDLVAAAVGEAGGGTLALIQIGTGIAGRWVVNGAAPPGANGYPGEIGHLRFRPDGRQCLCGKRGCAEAYGGWGAIRRRYEEAGRAVSSPAAVPQDARTDLWARSVFEDALEAIGFAASALARSSAPQEGAGKEPPGAQGGEMNREDEILKLARETANQQDGGEAFMRGLAVLARADVHEILAELAAFRERLDTPEAWEHVAIQARKLASAAAVVADQERENDPATNYGAW